MKMRNGTWLLGGLLLAVAWGFERTADASGPQQDKLLRGFQSSPQDAKPWVYWWFERGCGEPQGMPSQEDGEDLDDPGAARRCSPDWLPARKIGDIVGQGRSDGFLCREK